MQQNNKNTFLTLFSLLLIAYFIGIRAFFLVHQFSHHQGYSHQNLSAESKVDAKNMVDKKSNQRSEDREDDCLICHLASFYQNNILLAASIALAVLSFYLLHLFSLKNKIKLSYLLCSYQSQAPPAVL